MSACSLTITAEQTDHHQMGTHTSLTDKTPPVSGLSTRGLVFTPARSAGTLAAPRSAPAALKITPDSTRDIRHTELNFVASDSDALESRLVRRHRRTQPLVLVTGSLQVDSLALSTLALLPERSELCLERLGL